MLHDNKVELPHRITQNIEWKNNHNNHMHFKIPQGYLVNSFLVKIAVKTGVPVENVGLYRVTNTGSDTGFVKEEEFSDDLSFNELKPGVYFFRFEEGGYVDEICEENIL
jgi:hypothetical protein